MTMESNLNEPLFTEESISFASKQWLASDLISFKSCSSSYSITIFAGSLMSSPVSIGGDAVYAIGNRE